MINNISTRRETSLDREKADVRYKVENTIFGFTVGVINPNKEDLVTKLNKKFTYIDMHPLYIDSLDIRNYLSSNIELVEQMFDAEYVSRLKRIIENNAKNDGPRALRGFMLDSDINPHRLRENTVKEFLTDQFKGYAYFSRLESMFLQKDSSCLLYKDGLFEGHNDLIDEAYCSKIISVLNNKSELDLLEICDDINKTRIQIEYKQIEDLEDDSVDNAIYNYLFGDIPESKSMYDTELKFWKEVNLLLNKVRNRLIILIPKSYLYRSDSGIKKDLLKANLVEGVLEMSGPTFTSKACLLILNKIKSDKNVRFLDTTEFENKQRMLITFQAKNIYEAFTTNYGIAKIVPNHVILDSESIDLSVEKYKYYNEIDLRQQTTLENITTDIFRGIGLSARKLDELKPEDDSQNTCKIVSVKNLNEGYIDLDECETIEYDDSFSRYMLVDGDILISAKFSVLKLSMIEIPSNEKVIANESVLVVRCDRTKMKPTVLKCFFDSDDGKMVLDSVTSKRVISMIQVSALRQMPVPGIGLEEQKILEIKIEKLKNEIDSYIEALEEAQSNYKNLFKSIKK